MLSKNSQKEYYSGVRKCYQRTAGGNITYDLTTSKSLCVICQQPEGILHTVELESVIKEQPEGILHTVELGSVIKV